MHLSDSLFFHINFYFNIPIKYVYPKFLDNLRKMSQGAV